MKSREAVNLRLEALIKYFDIMNLAVASQHLMNRFLKERLPQVNWDSMHKNEIAIRYAIGELLTEKDVHAMQVFFGNKKRSLNILHILKKD